MSRVPFEKGYHMIRSIWRSNALHSSLVQAFINTCWKIVEVHSILEEILLPLNAMDWIKTPSRKEPERRERYCPKSPSHGVFTHSKWVSLRFHEVHFRSGLQFHPTKWIMPKALLTNLPQKCTIFLKALVRYRNRPTRCVRKGIQCNEYCMSNAFGTGWRSSGLIIVLAYTKRHLSLIPFLICIADCVAVLQCEMKCKKKRRLCFHYQSQAIHPWICISISPHQAISGFISKFLHN